MNQHLADLSIEKEIIGAILLDEDTFPAIGPIITNAMFANHRLSAAYEAYSRLYESKGLLDLRTIAKTAQISATELTDCMNDDIIPAMIVPKARKLRDLYHKRQIQRQVVETMAQLETLDAVEIAKRFSDLAAGVANSNHKKPVFDAEALCMRVAKLQEQRLEGQGKALGPTTGYSTLDRVIRGLLPKRVTVIAAATGFGKSSLALNLLCNTVTADNRALFISNENDVDLNLDRLCGIISGERLRDIESGTKYGVASAFGNHFFKSGLFMSDNSPRTIEEITALINRYKVQQQINVAFVDYIGEIQHNGDARETEESRLARYAQKLVDCAKELEIHVVVMAQLNRQGNSKGKPTKAELAGCFKIVQKAHSLLLFWQDEQKRDVLTVEKNRQGPVGIDIQLHFDRATQQITEGAVFDGRPNARCTTLKGDLP
ncbi:hypothetical protein L4X63_20455 [Geomonas sp. Red32]|uniref:DnaB-like helicase C-terminal domain-containing protein n=1 Tax=Geomonas sp. Red32 TaxID=2912856 RepID=UPI00202CE51C|nr:hypothetical protein [Geomonas sp. Red32]